jgi:hypothetical protein
MGVDSVIGEKGISSDAFLGDTGKRVYIGGIEDKIGGRPLKKPKRARIWQASIRKPRNWG